MGRKALNILRERFGRLIVIDRAGSNKNSGNILWLCQCDCGNEIVVMGSSLKAGKTLSCGCLRKEIVALRGRLNTRHGMSRSRLYSIWWGMHQRCFYKKHKSYHRYGGRGIKICDRWYEDFEAFERWAMSNGYKDDLTIDRIENNGNYEPNNCQWITMSENSKKQWKDKRKDVNV